MNNDKPRSVAPRRPGDPIRTGTLENGTRLHTLVDGRIFRDDGPTYELEYASYEPGKSYEDEISIIGPATNEFLYEAWNYSYDSFRTYAFHKTIRLTELKTGRIFTGEELRRFLGGEILRIEN